MELEKFSATQIKIVNNAVAVAEELVSNFYKMAASQWLKRKYDFKTGTDLKSQEMVLGPFAQIIRYEGHHPESSLGTSSYDFYKVCLQDHSILETLRKTPSLKLYPFVLYIGTHELIHIVRFSKFLQNFHATSQEKQNEERYVHQTTHKILAKINIAGLKEVFLFYHKWLRP
jgi:hypothetical protein